jgi:hypothetical protein
LPGGFECYSLSSGQAEYQQPSEQKIYTKNREYFSFNSDIGLSSTTIRNEKSDKPIAKGSEKPKKAKWDTKELDTFGKGAKKEENGNSDGLNRIKVPEG